MSNEINTQRQAGCRAHIQAAQREIDNAYKSVHELAEMYVDGYHFMSHKVSLFWKCDLSPLGMCVFTINDRGTIEDCMYCHQPQERK